MPLIAYGGGYAWLRLPILTWSRLWVAERVTTAAQQSN
jgi:hypothetical protein